jgi:hypothetical protein
MGEKKNLSRNEGAVVGASFPACVPRLPLATDARTYELAREKDDGTMIVQSSYVC